MLAGVDTPPANKVLLHGLLAWRKKLDDDVLSYGKTDTGN
jgi:hypothetical protein